MDFLEPATYGPLLGDFQSNLQITSLIDDSAMRPPRFDKMVNAQIDAMVAHTRAHGQGELHEPSLRSATAPKRDKAGESSYEQERLASVALHLLPHLDYDQGPAELSRIALQALAALLGEDAAYDSIPSDDASEGNALAIAKRDDVGFLGLRHLKGDMGDRLAAVLSQWATSDPPPRAMILDLSRCQYADAKGATALVDTFAPGRVALTADLRNVKKVVRQQWKGSGDWGSDVYASIPVFIVTSENTGSIAEAVAFGLRRYRGARILGRPTRGDGRWMSWYRLPYGMRFGFTEADLVDLEGQSLRGQALIPEACQSDAGVVAISPHTTEALRARCGDANVAREAAIEYVRTVLATETAP